MNLGVSIFRLELEMSNDEKFSDARTTLANADRQIKVCQDLTCADNNSMKTLSTIN